LAYQCFDAFTIHAISANLNYPAGFALHPDPDIGLTRP
jgi:hypothetical protein